MVPVPKAGLRDDCDRVKRVSKAGHENDSLWKAWKAKDLGFGAAGGGSEGGLGVPGSRGCGKTLFCIRAQL